MSSNPSLQFLKLGGSLITEKSQPSTVRYEVLLRLANEITAAFTKEPHMRLILGHGSGSFGHVPANRYATRQGVRTREEWRGFIKVAREASQLNRIVMEAIWNVGLPAITFSPSSSVVAEDGRISAWDITPIEISLKAELLPVVYGDVAFDTRRGGTILSTEDLFDYLARRLKPKRILLAGREPGVWANYPETTQLIDEITPHNRARIAPFLAGSAQTDVTGGMASKVEQSLTLVQAIPGLEIIIFSGETPTSVTDVLLGSRKGTLIWDGDTPCSSRSNSLIG